MYQGTYKSFPVQDDEHLYAICRYVERNALRVNSQPFSDQLALLLGGRPRKRQCTSQGTNEMGLIPFFDARLSRKITLPPPALGTAPAGAA